MKDRLEAYDQLLDKDFQVTNFTPISDGWETEVYSFTVTLRRLSDFAGSLGSGAESLGMRPETVAIMREQHQRYRQVYALLQARTGLRVPYLEQLLDSLSA